MKIYNDFIGNDENNITTNFHGGDNVTNLNENTPKQPSDWYYHNKKITYTFNNQGHRCRNFEDIDKNNYILYTGCSHTMGTGLELEKTYPYLLSKELGMDYYNLAMPATGMDIVEYNLLLWLFKVPKKPKLVVIQWPDHSRFAEYDSLRNNILARGSWQQLDNNYLALIANAEDTGMSHARKYMTFKLLENSIDLPLITFNYGNQEGCSIYDLNMPRIDKARDLSHAGIKSHVNFTKTLLNHIEVNRLLK